MTLPIAAIAEALSLTAAEIDGYGPDRAKLTLKALENRPLTGALVLVSAITPTPAGEGKTTVAIGLAEGLTRLSRRAAVCLREPSLGPVFGKKGGGTGGGASRLHPANAIDLHFTGDLHAITAANNLLAAMIDNHLHHDIPASGKRIDPGRVVWRRVMDINDRSLRNVVTGLGSGNGPTREASFDITAASEVMAVLCLATDSDDLKQRLGKMIVGFTPEWEPVTANDVGATGAMMALLAEACRPNLVQTENGTPALVHGGPFANIAHGCSSVLATRAALQRADIVVTEAGFGFDLGGEKFFDIKCRTAGLRPQGVVLIATIRALRWHGGQQLDVPDVEAVVRGLVNLDKHVQSVRAFGHEPVIAINHFIGDTPEEEAAVVQWCAAQGLTAVVADPFGAGGAGCEELATAVIEALSGERELKLAYALDDSVPAKVEAVARTVYGADGVVFTKGAKTDLRRIERLGLQGLPICMAKTPASLSDDATRRGRPTAFTVTVQEVRINAGAGFLVVLLGEIVRMPGLPKHPNALDIDVVSGKIVGL